MALNTDLLTFLKTKSYNDILNPAFVDGRMELFQYSGFNAETIIKAINTKLKAAGTPEEQYQMLFDMIFIGIVRGNMRKDTVPKTSEEGQARINLIVSKMGIVLRENEKDHPKLQNTSITFARVLQVMPHFAAKFLTKGQIEPSVVTHARWDVRTLPPAMQLSSFSSLLVAFRLNEWHNTKTYWCIYYAGLAWAHCFNRTINPKEEHDDLVKVRRYYDLAMNYNVITPIQALGILFDNCLMNKEGKVHPSIFLTCMEYLEEYPEEGTNPNCPVDNDLEDKLRVESGKKFFLFNTDVAQ